MGNPAGCELVAIEGDIVEIFERGGRRFARIVLAPRMVCEVVADGFGDAHLGDRVEVTGRVTIEQVAVVSTKDVV